MIPDAWRLWLWVAEGIALAVGVYTIGAVIVSSIRQGGRQ